MSCGSCPSCEQGHTYRCTVDKDNESRWTGLTFEENTMGIREYVHGCKVVGWIQTEMQGDAACGYIMVYDTDKAEYITAWYRQNDNEWTTGEYFMGEGAREKAYANFVYRANFAFGIRKEKIPGK